MPKRFAKQNEPRQRLRAEASTKQHEPLCGIGEFEGVKPPRNKRVEPPRDQSVEKTNLSGLQATDILPMAYLTVRIKDIAGHSTELLEGGDRLTVGRSSAADITLRPDSISREHCVFICEDEVWYLEDNGSATWHQVNSDKTSGRVTPQERDIIKIGKARLTFHVGKPGSRPKSGEQRQGCRHLTR